MAEEGGATQQASRFCNDCYSSDIIMNVINFVLDNVQEEVARKRLENLAIPLATDVAMMKLRRLMAWAVLDHDGKVEENTPLEYLEPDPEPKVLAIDPWARGMVPVKQVKIEAAASGMYRTLGGEAASGNMSPRSQSVGSRVSSNTGTSRSGTTRSGKLSGTSGVSRAGSVSGKLLEEEDPTGQVFDLPDSDEEEGYPGVGHMSLEQLLKKQAKAKAGADKEEQEVVSKSAYELLQQGIEEQVKELKGKKYTIDREGQVIPLVPVKAASLPPYQVNPETKISNYKEKQSRSGARKSTPSGGQAPGTGVDSVLVEASSSAADPKKKKEKRQVRVAGSRVVDEYTFLPSYTLADTLSTGEGLMPTSGVTINVNDQTRTGPVVPSIPGKMSRKEYASRNTTKSGVALESSLDDGTYDAGGSSQVLQAGELAFNDSMLPLSMQSGAPPAMRQELQYKIPDIDTFAGSRKKPFPEQPLSPSQREVDEGAGLGPVSNSLGGEPSIASRPGPKDPSIRLFTHDTTVSGKPTDRDLPKNMKHPSERTKPVAPPPGMVSIYDSPDKFAAARLAQGLPAKNASVVPHSPTGSAAESHDGSRSKVGQVRAKGGLIKNEKPHVAAQIF
jgi:hypothetical protein